MKGGDVKGKGNRSKLKGQFTMKRLFFIALALGLILAVSNQGWAQCATIKDGTIVDTKGNPIKSGYDKWGYNYQAHMFNGLYWNYSRPEPPWTKETLIAAEKSTNILVMKWNDTWLSNKDCNLDGKLDRGYPCNPNNPTSSACDGAWETNHQTGWTEVDGEMRKWTYFVKIVKVPEGEGNYSDSDYWYTIDGVEIGSVIWGA